MFDLTTHGEDQPQERQNVVFKEIWSKLMSLNTLKTCFLGPKMGGSYIGQVEIARGLKSRTYNRTIYA